MRTIVLTAAVIGALLGSACSQVGTTNLSSENGTSVAATKGDDPLTAEKARAVLQTEPKIKDVLYQPGQAVEWMVGVLDDGTLRNGYAGYVCEVLADQGLKREGLIVRVVDIAKVAQGGVPGRSTSLGSMRCDTNTPFD